MYKWVEESIGWTIQQYRNAINTVFKANYSTCAYHFFLSPLGERAPSNFLFELFLLPWDTDKLALVIIHFMEDSSTMVTFVDYDIGYLTKQDQLHLLLCTQGLRDNKDSNCHRLRLPSIASLYVSYYPYGDTLYQMKSTLPNLEHIDVKLLNRDWNQFTNVMESLSKSLKQHEIILTLLNLRIEIHLVIFISHYEL